MQPNILSKNPPLTRFFSVHKKRIEEKLAEVCPSKPVSPIENSINYTLEKPGKLFRPLAVLAAADLFNKANSEKALSCAVAVELIHTASLILDDLPCMDNATMRRGQHTVHRKFGEAQAILAAFALIAEANLLISSLGAKYPSEAPKFMKCLETINASYSINGLAGGQSLELNLDSKAQSISSFEIEQVHQLKTGSLIKAGLLLPCYLWSQNPDHEIALTSFANHIGLAFQIKDDSLDFQSSKTTGKNGKQSKVNYLLHKNEIQARKAIKNEVRLAKHCLSEFGDSSSALLELVDFI